jgi:hypothetical protein
MSLKNKFLTYVEHQRSANSIKESKGPDSRETIEAYSKANQLKREILDMIEQYENSNSK